MTWFGWAEFHRIMKPNALMRSAIPPSELFSHRTPAAAARAFRSGCAQPIAQSGFLALERKRRGRGRKEAANFGVAASPC
jgi:hypothetical protein